MLDGLRRQSAPGFETVVVVDGTDQVVPDLGAVTVVVKEQGGPGAARNAGARATDRPIVLFLGDDMLPAPDLVARHVHRHNADRDETVAVLGHVNWHKEVAANRIARWLDWSGTQFDYRRIAGSDAGFGRFYSATCHSNDASSSAPAVSTSRSPTTTKTSTVDTGWVRRGCSSTTNPQRARPISTATTGKAWSGASRGWP